MDGYLAHADPMLSITFICRPPPPVRRLPDRRRRGRLQHDRRAPPRPPAPPHRMRYARTVPATCEPIRNVLKGTFFYNL